MLPHAVMTYVKLYDFMLRFTHATRAVRAGVGAGIMIPIMKKIAKWDAGIRATVTNLGHFHQYYDLPFLTINSSLIGFDEYALEIAARPEDPCQAFYLIDKKRGKSMSGRIWAEDSKRFLPRERSRHRPERGIQQDPPCHVAQPVAPQRHECAKRCEDGIVDQ